MGALPERACVALRPERIRVSAQEPAQENRARGRISGATFFGTHVELDVVVQGVVLNVLLPAVQAAEEPALVAEGAEVWLGWTADVTLLLRDDAEAA
jgi:ABC-type Fe3+/spermidine/putrescine transport system ATPase subunit